MTASLMLTAGRVDDSQFNRAIGFAVETRATHPTSTTPLGSSRELAHHAPFWPNWPETKDSVYVADFFNDRIQKFTSTGAFLGKWGSTGSGNGQFIGPRAVAVDEVGTVFAVDDGHDRIEVFTETGIFLAEWGSLGFYRWAVQLCDRLAVDHDGTVLVTDDNHRVQRFA